MRNPWLDLEPDKYILDADRAAVDRFNSQGDDNRRILTDVLPEPFLGSPDAPVVLLSLNPGTDRRDYELHRRPQFVASNRANLRHEPQPYPFYLLDPNNEGPGRTWWRKKLRVLIAQYGDQTVARRVMCVEYFPYHSKRYAHDRLRLTSQSYSFWLVANATERGATIIAMRSLSRWIAAVPSLRTYERLVTVANPQNPAISPRNCGERWPEVIRAIASASVG